MKDEFGAGTAVEGIPRAIPASRYLCPGKSSLEFQQQARGSDWIGTRCQEVRAPNVWKGPPAMAARTRGHSPSNHRHPAAPAPKNGNRLREPSGNSRESWLGSTELPLTVEMLPRGFCLKAQLGGK